MYAATLVAFRAEINTYQGYSKTCRMVKEINNFYDKPAISMQFVAEFEVKPMLAV